MLLCLIFVACQVTQLLMQCCIVGFLHYYNGLTIPLVLSSIMGLWTLPSDHLVQIYIRGRSPTDPEYTPHTQSILALSDYHWPSLSDHLCSSDHCACSNRDGQRWTIGSSLFIKTHTHNVCNISFSAHHTHDTSLSMSVSPMQFCLFSQWFRFATELKRPFKQQSPFGDFTKPWQDMQEQQKKQVGAHIVFILCPSC